MAYKIMQHTNMVRCIWIAVQLVLFLAVAAVGHAEKLQVKIGVLAKRGTVHAIAQWQPTTELLNQAIPQYRFTLVPLSFDRIRTAVAEKQIDFLLANPAIYVEMEHDFDVSRIVTMENLILGQGYTHFCGVIFSRAAHPIDSVEQLRDKTFMAVDPTSLGGALAAWRELIAHGFNPYNEFGQLYYGKTHDAVVFAVRDGKVDAGTVRSDTLERMASEGKIALQDFHVLSLWHKTGDSEAFPFQCSTRHYPEWPMARLPHVPEYLAKEVSIALLAMPKHHPAAKAARIAGWTIPQNYLGIHECLQVLHLPPYDHPPHLSLKQLFQQYWMVICLAVTLLTITTWLMFYFRNLGRRLKASEHSLREAHAELDQLFQASPDGIFRVDNDKNILRANRTFAKMTGIPAHELIGKKCYEAFPGENCNSSLCPLTAIAADKQSLVREIVKQAKDGHEIPCLMFATPYRNQDGTIGGMVEFYRDISVLKQTESDLQHSRDALQQAYQELQRNQSQMLQREKMASIGQLAAGVAHEINNPLGFIGSNLCTLNKYWEKSREFMQFLERSLAEQNDADATTALGEKRRKLKIDQIIEDADDLIEESLEGVERVKIIVSNLKSFSRVEQAKYDRTDINQCLDATLSIIWNELKYHVTVHKDYADIPATYCYPQQLNQVFMNLLLNAGHAIEGSGEIFISTQSAADQIVIKIRDTGSGIAEENLSRLFDPFFTTKEVGKGTGLGLSIVYDIIKKHQGSIDVKSELGAGTTFIITLPVVKAKPEDPTNAAHASDEGTV